MSSSWNDHPSKGPAKLKIVPPRHRLASIDPIPAPKPTKADVARVMAALQRIADDRIRLAYYGQVLERIATLGPDDTVHHAVYLARRALVSVRTPDAPVEHHPA